MPRGAGKPALSRSRQEQTGRRNGLDRRTRRVQGPGLDRLPLLRQDFQRCPYIDDSEHKEEEIMGFGTIEIHAGDFKKGKASQFVGGKFLMKNEGKILREKILVSEVETLEEATEENIIKIGGAVGWGVAGGVLLGPLGLLAGLVLGGKGKNTTFICRFKDGRKFLATTSTKEYNNLRKHVLSQSL